MKKTIFIALLAIFSLSAAPVIAAKSSTNATEATSKLTKTEMSNYRARVVEISEMDKSDMSVIEKNELKSELKDIKATMRSNGPYIYIGGSTILIIILLLLIF